MSQSMGGLVATAEEQYKKLNLPSLPDSVRELFVTFAPWLALLGGILGLLVFIPGVLLLLTLSPLAGAGGAGIGYVLSIIHLILSAAGAVISLMAFSGLRKHTLRGWTLLFWAAAVYFVAGLLPISISGIIGAVLGVAISLYVLFQIKPYYDGTRSIPVAAPAAPPPSPPSEPAAV
jgi:hypothetical protein